MLKIPAKSFDLITNITRVRCALRMMEELHRADLLPHEIALYSKICDELDNMQEALHSRWCIDIA